MKGKIVEFLKDESGQTSTEYILLVALVAMIVMKFGGKLKTELLKMVDNVFSTANKELSGGI
jgi:pilus assembly protein Flp/PilA